MCAYKTNWIGLKTLAIHTLFTGAIVLEKYCHPILN